MTTNSAPETTISTTTTPTTSHRSEEANTPGGVETAPPVRSTPSRGVGFHASTSIAADERSTKTGGTGASAMSYEARAKSGGMRYTLSDIPSLPVSILLGLQHYFTFLGATVIIPLIICPPMGATPKQTAEVISTILFTTGFNTLLQTTLGTRLPIVQGGSFAFLTPVFSIIANPELQAIEDDNERFHQTMRTISGSILISGVIQLVIGLSGGMVPLFKFISPVTITGVITIVGLSLYNVAFNDLSTCFPIGLIELFLIILFSQYLKNITMLGYPIFSLFPVIMAIGITWIYAATMTASNVWEDGNACRTDGTRDLVIEADWFRIPYPGQWGTPIFKASAIIPMLGGMLAGMIESIGDYYSCARLSGAPPPTPGIMSRGLASEGLGLIVSGLMGTGAGTTSYSENIGAMALTRVGSRVVIQCGAISAICISCFGKIIAIFASLPTAMAGGVYCVLFALIAAVGLSNLQYINLNSERNLFIVGFSIFNSMSIAGPSGYFNSQPSNPFGTTNLADIAHALFSSPILIVLLLSLFLDNTIPGTRKERGLLIWARVRNADVNNEPEYVKAYSLPLCFAKLFRNFSYLEYFARGEFPEPPEMGYQAGRGDVGELCCPCIFPREYALREDGDEEMAEQDDDD